MSPIADSTTRTSALPFAEAFFADEEDSSYEIGKNIVYVDAETGEPYVLRFDGSGRTVEVPLSQSNVSLNGASAPASNVQLPVQLVHGEGGPETIFNSFKIAPDENGTMTLYASNTTSTSEDALTWIPLGPPQGDGFDDVVPGAVLVVTGSGSQATGFDSSYISTSDVPVGDEQIATPAKNYSLEIQESDPGTKMLDEAGAEVGLKNVPTVRDPQGNNVHLDKIAVVENDDGTKQYIGFSAVVVEGETTYQNYDLGYAPDDAPVGMFSSTTSNATAEGSGKFDPMYAGTHNSQGFATHSSKRGNKDTILLDENNTGSIDSPIRQGKSGDRAVVTQFYDSENNSLTYYVNGGGKKSWDDDDSLDLLVGPGGAEEWKVSEGHTVGGEGGYTKYFHEPTNATVYAKEYENVNYVEMEPKKLPDDHFSSSSASEISPRSKQDYSGHLDLQANSANYEEGRTGLASDIQIAPENKLAFSFENSKFEYPYDLSKMTQYHASEGDRRERKGNDYEYRANVLVDENGPVLHAIDLANGTDTVVLPGKLSDYAELTEDQLNGSQGFGDKKVLVHKETGALFVMSGVEEIQYTGNYDKIK